MSQTGRREDTLAPRILGCDYVSLPVNRFDEAVEFYSDTVGLRLVNIDPPRWAEFDVGPFRIALFPSGSEDRRGGEIAFLVEDLQSEIERLEARGVVFPHGVEEFNLPTGGGASRPIPGPKREQIGARRKEEGPGTNKYFSTRTQRGIG